MSRGRRAVRLALRLLLVLAILLELGRRDQAPSRELPRTVAGCGESWWEGAGRAGAPCPQGYQPGQ